MATYITKNPDFTFKHIQVENKEYGEYSHTMEKYKHIDTIDDVPLEKGDLVYRCFEGAYNLYEVI